MANLDSLKGAEDDSEIRPIRIASAVIIGVATYVLPTVAERLEPLPRWVALSFGIAVVTGAVVTPILFLNGIGIVTSKRLAAGTPVEEANAGRILTASQFIAVYLGSLFVLVGAAFAIEHFYDVRWFLSIFALCGLLFVVASSKRPWWWFYTMRRMGWFALIQNDRVMQFVLAALGIALIVFAFLASA
jgi:hypothetical protein